MPRHPSRSRRTAAEATLPPLLLLLLLAVARSAEGAATRPPLALTIAQVGDSALAVDPGSPGAGPRAAYLSYRVTNSSGSALTNLSASLAGLGAVATLGNGQQAAQYLGTLGAGQSRTLYWFVTYTAAIGARSVASVTVSNGTGGTATGVGPLRTVAFTSAAQGGTVTAATLGSGGTLGQRIDLDVTYQFGGWKAGDVLSLQPAGNSDFAGGCYQLVRTLVQSATPNLDAVIPPGATDRLRFVAPVKNAKGGSHSVVLRYSFRYLCAGTSTTPVPYSTTLSGKRARFSLGYGPAGVVPPPIPAAPAPAVNFTVAKVASSPQLPTGGAESYSVTIENRSSFDVTLDSVRDVLPAGVTFAATSASSDVGPGNSGATPVTGSTGAVVWRATPTASYAIAAGGTLRLAYTASITGTPGQYTNTATPYVGRTALGSGSATVTVGRADLVVTKSGPPTGAVQDTLAYALRVQNAGPATAFQVTIVDSLPAGVTFVRATNGGSASLGVVRWPALAALGVGAGRVDSVIVVAPATLGTIVNRAAASAASADPNPSNNDGSAIASQASTMLTTGVSVTPDGPATPRKRLPGTAYAETFTIANQSGSAASYGLRATPAPAMLVVDSLTGASLSRRPRRDSAVAALAPHASADIRVWYTVPVGDTVTSVQALVARHLLHPTTIDTGWVALRRVFPALTMSKSVTPGGTVSPGVDLTFATTFVNVGEADASAVRIADDVAAAVDFQVGSPAATLPGGVTATLEYSNDGGATWTYVPVSGACAAPVGYDGCVTQVRWSLGMPLPPSATASTVQFIGRVR